MAVSTNVRGDRETLYEGCVLSYRETNGYHDSDWYALVWDDKAGEVVEFLYQTTRAPIYGNAEIDITRENLRKVYRYYYRRERTAFDHRNRKRAASIDFGKQVRVTRGRKVPVGTVGTVFWIGETRYGERAGIETEYGEKHFVPIDYIEVIDPDRYLIRGNERNEEIRRNTISFIPVQLHEILFGGDKRDEGSKHDCIPTSRLCNST